MTGINTYTILDRIVRKAIHGDGSCECYLLRYVATEELFARRNELADDLLRYNSLIKQKLEKDNGDERNKL